MGEVCIPCKRELSCSSQALKFAFSRPPAQPPDPEKGREPHWALPGWPARKGKGGTEKYFRHPTSRAIPAQLHTLNSVCPGSSNPQTYPSPPSGTGGGAVVRSLTSHWHIVGVHSHILKALLSPRPCMGAGEKGMSARVLPSRCLCGRQDTISKS